MALITFGNLPADMRETGAWGYVAYLPEEGDPEFVSLTATEIVIREPLTGSTASFGGTFDVAAIQGSDPTGSFVSSGVVRTESGELLFSITAITPPAPLVIFFDEEDTLPRLAEGDDTVAGSPASDRLVGGPGNDEIDGNGGDDTIYGSEGDDTMNGVAGNDWFEAGPGDDLIDGGEGIDTLALGKSLASYLPGAAGDLLQIQDQVGGEGTDLVRNVERFELLDTNVAVDIARGQQAGDVMALLAAGFGASAATDPALLGLWLPAPADDRSIEQIAQAIIDTHAPPGFSNEDLITHLYFTIVGEFPSADEVETFANLGLSQSGLYVLGANSDPNWDNLAPVALQGYVEYSTPDPVGGL